MRLSKGDIVKLRNGEEVIILNLPTSFMANGSYEVSQWLDNGVGIVGEPFWVKADDVLYEIDIKHKDDINNYFEFIFDETGINIIPKDLINIDIESDRDDIKRIKLSFNDGRKHTVANIHIGDMEITDKEKIVTQPEPIVEDGKIKKIFNNITKEK